MAIFGVAYAYYNNARPASRRLVSLCFKCGEHVYTHRETNSFRFTFPPTAADGFFPKCLAVPICASSLRFRFGERVTYCLIAIRPCLSSPPFLCVYSRERECNEQTRDR